MCPIQVHFLRVIVVSMESCSAMFHNSLLVILSFQLMLKILLKQLLMKTWILRCSCLVVLQVSDPYSSTDFTLELKIFSLVCLEMILDFHNLSNMWNATLAFPSLALTSSSVPPSVLTMLPRYVNCCTSSTLPEDSCIGSIFFSMALFFYIAENTLQRFCEILTLIQCTFICAIKLKLVVTLESLYSKSSI